MPEWWNHHSSEIIKELTALKDISEVCSEQVLIQAQRVEAQRAQKAVLDFIRDTKYLRLNKKR